MDPEAAEFIASLQPSDEELSSMLDEIRRWSTGVLPARAFGYCALAWPRVREIALKEWQEQLADPLGCDIGNMLPTVAWYLAAAKRDETLLAPLLEGWGRHEAVADLLFGDVLLEDGACFVALMASRSAEGISLLEEAALPQKKITPVTNALPLDALSLLVAEGVVERDRFDQIVRRCIQAVASNDFADDANERRAWLVVTLCDLGIGDFAEEIRGWFEQGLMKTSLITIIDRKEFEDAVARGLTTPDPEWQQMERCKLICSDTYEAVTKWTLQGEETGEKDVNVPEGEYQFYQDPYVDPDEVTVPLYRTEPKVGRNDPCPCNSGKKYKKCCGKAG